MLRDKVPLLLNGQSCGRFLQSRKDCTNASYYLQVHGPWALLFTF